MAEICCDMPLHHYTWVNGVWGMQCISCGAFYPK